LKIKKETVLVGCCGCYFSKLSGLNTVVLKDSEKFDFCFNKVRWFQLLMASTGSATSRQVSPNPQPSGLLRAQPPQGKLSDEFENMQI
jgi:hypothetical protein